MDLTPPPPPSPSPSPSSGGPALDPLRYEVPLKAPTRAGIAFAIGLCVAVLLYCSGRAFGKSYGEAFFCSFASCVSCAVCAAVPACACPEAAADAAFACCSAALRAPEAPKILPTREETPEIAPPIAAIGMLF